MWSAIAYGYHKPSVAINYSYSSKNELSNFREFVLGFTSLNRGLFGAEYLSRMEREQQRFPGTILAERVPDGLESRKCDGMPLKKSRVRWPARSA